MREWVVISTLVGVLCASLAWGQDVQYRWSMIRFGGPDVNNTEVRGTNDAAWFAGNWSGHQDPTNPGGAFRSQKGRFIPFAVPGAVRTEISDIESSSTIVGTYWLPDGSLHAFLYRHGLGVYETIDIPGAFWSFPFKVNAKREVAMGWFSMTPQGGIRWDTGIYDWRTKQVTVITLPEASDLVIRGLNNHGEVVGNFTELDPDDPCACWFWDRGFFRGADGEIVHLTAPDGGPVFPFGINDHGIVVGETWRQEGQGFRWDLNTGDFQDLAHPVRRGSEFRTYISDIDNQGRMVAVNQRLADDYVVSYWLRPVK